VELRRAIDGSRVSAVDRAAAIALLCGSLAGCSNPAGPSGGPTTFSGEAIVADPAPGSPFGTFFEVEGEFRDDGRLRADLTWRVVAAGSGRFGSQDPGIQLEFFRFCPGWQCPGYASAGPATEPPLSVAGDIVRGRTCGGCRIQYTLQIQHPSGSVRVRS